MTEDEPQEGSVDQQLAIITERTAERTTHLAVAGEVDLATAPQLRTALVQAVDAALPPRQVVVDLAQVQFIDAVGLGVLVGCRNAALLAGIGFQARNADGLVWRVIEVVGLVEVLNAPRRSR